MQRWLMTTGCKSLNGRSGSIIFFEFQRHYPHRTNSDLMHAQYLHSTSTMDPYASMHTLS